MGAPSAAVPPYPVMHPAQQYAPVFFQLIRDVGSLVLSGRVAFIFGGRI